MKTELEILTQEYKALSQNFIDLERLNLYLISHHSTAIEGSTLTVLETEIFLEKGLTAKGKPLEHLFMINLNNPHLNDKELKELVNMVKELKF